jgi:hypothetical protein
MTFDFVFHVPGSMAKGKVMICAAVFAPHQRSFSPQHSLFPFSCKNFGFYAGNSPEAGSMYRKIFRSNNRNWAHVQSINIRRKELPRLPKAPFFGTQVSRQILWKSARNRGLRISPRFFASITRPPVLPLHLAASGTLGSLTTVSLFLVEEN